MKPRTTLSDVARAAGVSAATVSMALRNHPRISEARRREIKRLAEELGYRPDPALARLAAHRWRLEENVGMPIAFVTTRYPGSNNSDDFAVRSAQEYARGLGYALTHFREFDHETPERLADVLFARGIEGVIVDRVFNREFADRFPWQRFSCVSVNAGYYVPPVNSVLPDLTQSLRKAWSECRNRGYRRIGFAINKEPIEPVDHFQKLSAILACQQQVAAGSRLPVGLFAPESPPALKPWMERHRPDVVIAYNQMVYWNLHNLGIVVPDQLGFVSLMESHISGVDITGFYAQTDLCALEAVNQLDLQLRTHQFGIPERPLTIFVSTDWHEGSTLPLQERLSKSAAGSANGDLGQM